MYLAFATKYKFDSAVSKRPGYCRNICSYREYKLNDNLYEGPNRLWCYECIQQCFIRVLHDIVSGKQYSQIKNFPDLLNRSRNIIRTYRNIDIFSLQGEEKLNHAMSLSHNLFNKENLWLDVSTNRTEKLGLKDGYFDFESFVFKVSLNDLLFDVASYNLSAFLLFNKRDKLNCCKKCNRFYISKTIRPSKYCSDKCRLSYHNQERIKSGKAKEYKRKKRREGAKPSYYG